MILRPRVQPATAISQIADRHARLVFAFGETQLRLHVVVENFIAVQTAGNEIELAIRAAHRDAAAKICVTGIETVQPVAEIIETGEVIEIVERERNVAPEQIEEIVVVEIVAVLENNIADASVAGIENHCRRVDIGLPHLEVFAGEPIIPAGGGLSVAGDQHGNRRVQHVPITLNHDAADQGDTRFGSRSTGK